jgi:hypothetical protein
MDESDLGITAASEELYKEMLAAEQTVPSGSLFRDGTFKKLCQKLRNRNEATVIRNISQLIVPSAENLAMEDASHLDIVTESANEGWSNSVSLTTPRPQPDYSVGFKREAFTKIQLEKLTPFIGNFIAGDHSYFMATYYMYFPFLTCEVKCGSGGLDIADRQNAHSMTIAVRAVVELFRLVHREMELHREILGFSISHDNRLVRIYGHYPVIDGQDTTYYRHLICAFDFTVTDGKERWTTYKFVKEVYGTWMPVHFKRLAGAIDEIPSDIDFSISAPQEQPGLSKDLESRHISERSEINPLLEENSRRSTGDVGNDTPDTSFPRPAAVRRSKRKRPTGQ